MSKPVELNYKQMGEGFPIVVLHGLFGMLDNLQLFGKALSEHDYMVYLVDQRNHGRSPRNNDFSYPALATDLLHFMETHWLHRTVLIGHSMGGKAALQFVKDHSDHVTKLVIIDIGIKKYEGGHETIFEALSSLPLNETDSREAAFNKLKQSIGDESVVHFLMKNLTRNKETHAFEWKMNLPVLVKNYYNILDSVPFDGPLDTEVLFIRGDRSNYIQDEDIPEIKKYFPNASFVTIPNAGHWIHVDNLPVLISEIISFLKT
ncbi:MAG: alpha/beta fold hydrolase [Saprospiraceae bacterium]|nr:alpha/beta fold hydrolase [Saprospiraceae bacterium]MBK6565562.1 alpha/beta fold hydrolase [Saprospiraceae bacterium]MBK6785670.1 alpha/beta fold hydrolase [Saprospiraceae bacterium]MBK8081918.1 alpha/beta fold hydrolase [Saprospiraceae bacterium]MBK8370548.1 alpha/beta fold hydrolase [Saprospiraceae bacterium]